MLSDKYDIWMILSYLGLVFRIDNFHYYALHPLPSHQRGGRKKEAQQFDNFHTQFTFKRDP